MRHDDEVGPRRNKKVGLLVLPRQAMHRRIARWLVTRRLFGLARLHSQIQLLRHPDDADHLNVLAQYHFEHDRFREARKWAVRAFEACDDFYAQASLAVLASLACARLDDAAGAGFWLHRAVKVRPEFHAYAENDQFLAQAAKRPEFHQWNLRVAGMPDLLVP